jgi:type IV secretion system protein VirD4
LKGDFPISRKKLIKIFALLPPAIIAVLYAGGYLAQFLRNYDTWQTGGGTLYGESSPEFPDPGFITCIAAVFRFPYGLYGVAACVGTLALLILMVMKMGTSDNGEYDRERNLVYSRKGTYGTAGYLSRKELGEVLDLVPDIRKHPGVILGEMKGQVVCVPAKTRFNGNMAVYGASGSKKTRAFCVNRILQAANKLRLDGVGESLIICDPKSGATRS